MRYLLVTLGVLALVFAGCATTTSTTDEVETYTNNEPQPDFDDSVTQSVTVDEGDSQTQSVTITE